MRENERELFQRVYQATEAAAVRIARRWVRDKGMAEDVCQEAYCRLWFAITSGAAVEDWEAWLLAVVRHEAQRVGKAAAKSKLLPIERIQEPAAQQADAAQTAPAPEWIGAALAELPEVQREALLLKAVQGMTYRDVGGVLGCSHSTAERRVEAGLVALRGRLREAESPVSSLQ